jgi:hypothetical protein
VTLFLLLDVKPTNRPLLPCSLEQVNDRQDNEDDDEDIEYWADVHIHLLLTRRCRPIIVNADGTINRASSPMRCEKTHDSGSLLALDGLPGHAGAGPGCARVRAVSGKDFVATAESPETNALSIALAKQHRLVSKRTRPGG